MEKKLLQKIKQKLKREKIGLEKELKEFAKKYNGRWETTFPAFNGGESGNGLLEKGADEVEEYGMLLSLTLKLENKLKEINLALEKIEKGKYGICEKCQKEIEKERLQIYPETKFCSKCKKE